MTGAASPNDETTGAEGAQVGPDLRNGQFHFAVGIEDTFVPHTRPGHRALDEYELTGHYAAVEDDLALAAATGATAIRYGIPWYRVNPAPGTFDWGWLDRAVDALDASGLEPIVDLMHYGTPLWLENEFLNSQYPDYVAEYAAAVADRYRGRLRCFTPLNEPLVNAEFCGATGTWPPYLRGDDGFVKMLRSLCRGIVQTQRAIADLTGGAASFVHVEASFLYRDVADADREQVEHLRQRAYVVEDLVTGMVDQQHPLVDYLLRSGFSDGDLQWHLDHKARPDIMGVNYYPQMSVTDGSALHGPKRRIWGGTEGLTSVVTSWAERYGRPVMITETSVHASHEERARWMRDSVRALLDLRDGGYDIVGYTWFPLFDLIDWQYRLGTETAPHYLMPFGLADLVPDDRGGFDRRPTDLVDLFHRFAAEHGARRGQGDRKDSTLPDAPQSPLEHRGP